MKRLFYDSKAATILSRMPLLAERAGVTMDNRYIHFYNDTCPSCLGKFKLSHDRTVRGVGCVVAAMLTSPQYGKLVPYALCKKCSKTISKQQANKVEEYLIKQLNL